MNSETAAPLNILLVDDEPEVTELLSFSLRREPYRIRTAASGREALKLAKEEPVDILVTDIKMPQMDGLELIEKMRSMLPDLLVIVISAHGDVDLAVRAMKGGAVDFLQKPINSRMLKIAIELAAEKWSLRHRLEISNQKLQLEVEERRRIQIRLEEEKELLAVTLRSIGEGVIATDVKGRVLLVNREAEQMTGWPQAEAVMQPLEKVLCLCDEKGGEPLPAPLEGILKSPGTEESIRQGILHNRRGETMTIRMSAAPIMNRNSAPVGMVCVFSDITEQLRIEEELFKMEKLESVGVLAGGIAHDFNNILSGILGNLELASCRTSDGSVRELLENASRAAKRAAGLTRQLLTFSSGGDPVRKPTSLPELVRDSVEFVLKDSRCTCSFDFADNLWPVNVDGGQIAQVIQNLLVNADQAMPGGGTIRVAAVNVDEQEAVEPPPGIEGDFVRMTVTDSGTGIAPEIRDRIFDPYFSTRQNGSGLGLAVCHSIVSKHDGALEVDSTPGQGATFTVYLPAESASMPHGEGRAEEETAGTGQARVLVMDDEEMLRSIAAAILQTMGHEAVTAGDGQEALDIFRRMRDAGRAIDLVIMDLTIPGGMGGRETMEKLLEIDPGIRGIVSSGYFNDPVMADYAKYGFVAAIAKPFDMRELSSVVNEVLQKANGSLGETQCARP